MRVASGRMHVNRPHMPAILFHAVQKRRSGNAAMHANLKNITLSYFLKIRQMSMRIEAYIACHHLIQTLRGAGAMAR